MELNILQGSIDSCAPESTFTFILWLLMLMFANRDIWLHDLCVSYQQCRHAINVQVTKRRQFGRCRARRQCMNTLELLADLCKMVLLITVPAAFPKGRALARLMNSPAVPTISGVLIVLGQPRLGCKGTLASRLETAVPLANQVNELGEVEAADVGVNIMALACDLLDSAVKQRVIVFSKVSLGSRKRRSFKARLRILFF